MNRLRLGMGSIVVLWAILGVAHGHPATELYIPLGQSPGISNKVTHIGAIDAVDAAGRTITVGSRTVTISEETKIYLDRSALKQKNVTGTFADLRTGRTVEIRYRDAAKKHVARWVKVQVEP